MARAVGQQVSIHVPTRGTTAKDGDLTGEELFQSTFPRGERRGKDGE